MCVMHRLRLDGGEIEYEVRGKGDPVLLINPGVIGNGLAQPLFGRPELTASYRLIHYCRRGYMTSTRGPNSLTIPRQAADAAALLRHLAVSDAHVVGHSYGGLIALQLALDAPDLVHSLALLEPALIVGPAGRVFLEHTVGLAREQYRSGDKRGFIEQFTDGVFGPGWQAVVERALPGASEQAVADADAFYEELAALPDWEFGPDEAAAIKQPVLSVLGTRSAAHRPEARRALHSWLPQTEDFDLDTTHMLQIEDPTAMAKGLAGFFGRHPIS